MRQKLIFAAIVLAACAENTNRELDGVFVLAECAAGGGPADTVARVLPCPWMSTIEGTAVDVVAGKLSFDGDAVVSHLVLRETGQTATTTVETSGARDISGTSVVLTGLSGAGETATLLRSGSNALIWQPEQAGIRARFWVFRRPAPVQEGVYVLAFCGARPTTGYQVLTVPCATAPDADWVHSLTVTIGPGDSAQYHMQQSIIGLGKIRSSPFGSNLLGTYQLLSVDSLLLTLGTSLVRLSWNQNGTLRARANGMDAFLFKQP